jgi:hypothetical protein
MEVVVVGATVVEEPEGAVVLEPVDAALVVVDEAVELLAPPHALRASPLAAKASKRLPALRTAHLRS